MRISSPVSAMFMLSACVGLSSKNVATAFTPATLRRGRSALVTASRTRSTTSLSANQKRKSGGREKKPKNVYAPTIILPETPFSQRANAIQREPELQQFWKEYGLYDKLSDAAKDSTRFVLHDGPPYANGDLHIGHALNKLLKDFINRKQVLKGKQVHYVPGWDCHGLPIELKVLQGIKSKERQSLTPLQLREKAAAFAKETVDKQSQSFQRYGIFGDFDHPYLTLQPEFEAAQIGVFGKMFQQGYIFRGRKPVHWSPSSQTALAEAELEYPEGHISKSIYVGFPVQNPSQALQEHHSEEQPIQVAIWTTTPWTMPANMAVAINPDLNYSIVQHESTGKLLIATDLISTIAKKLNLPEGEEFTILKSMEGEEIVGTTYVHPLYSERDAAPVLAGGDYITTESGTGLVHTAPGHGQEDYLTGMKYGLELLSPVDDVGKFTIEAGEKFAGLKVLAEGNEAIIEALKEKNALLRVEDYNHKYPYDWRTKKPTIFRATDQWFASVEGFRDDALAAIDTVKWVPDVGKNRITSFVSGRGDWCISRQRSWGVPIPVFYDRETGNEVLLNDDTLEHIQNIFAEHGSDAWWKMDEAELLPPKYKDEADKWKKGTDTMDVWFDSGSSWSGVASSREELAYPADIYLEGSVIEGGNNKKIDPAYGADVLRLWVALVDYVGDTKLLENLDEKYHLGNYVSTMVRSYCGCHQTISSRYEMEKLRVVDTVVRRLFIAQLVERWSVK